MSMSEDSMRSAIRQRTSCRVSGDVARQLGRARRAASTAASTSAGRASGIDAHDSPVLGSIASKASSDISQSPPMSIARGTSGRYGSSLADMRPPSSYSRIVV
ncbi:unannotated protein [freshwater metagenome]|uniref:Unannotated protein n=1 Tax=freshwater metagenome TaxID=449393 RepID=A0A6J7R3D3_9ZZZZ